MSLSLGLGLGLSRQGGGGGAVNPSDAMFSALAVNSDGWTLDATIAGAKDGGAYSGLNDKATPGLALTVRSRSWDSTGAETTLDRTVYATSVVRKSYPDGTSLQETEDGSDCDVVFSLSNYIHADDQIVSAAIASGFFTDSGTGGSGNANAGGTNSVTNNSTQAYYQPQACWLTPPLERVTASDWAPRLFVMHRYAQQGRPVKAVKFTATDESGNSVTSTVTALSHRQYSASGLYANWFEPDWDLSSLTDGDIITVDATIYPWVGNSFTLSTDADAYPSPNICVLKAVCDVGGTYGTVYAYVDGVGAGTPAASTDAATAAAAPFASISAAATAAIALNNSTYGRNSLSGVTIRIPANTTITGLGADTMDGLTEGDLPLLIEGVDQATSIYTNAVTNANNDTPGAMKMKSLTFQKNGASIIGFDGKNLIANQLVFENVTFDLNGNSFYNGWLYQTGRQYFVNCDGDSCGQGIEFSSNVMGAALVVGCGFVPTTAYNVVACDTPSNFLSPVGNLGGPSGCIYAFNFARTNGSVTKVLEITDTDFGDSGVSVVGNILETYGTATGQTLLFSGDGDVTPVINGIEAANTFVGVDLAAGRANVGYQDSGTAKVIKDIVSKHSVFTTFNSKSDYFGTQNANRVGNWALRHGVDGGYRFIWNGDSSGTTSPGYAEWIGEGLGDDKTEMPVGDVVGGSPDFADNQSGTSGSGNGDYTPGADSDIPAIPAGLTMFAVDLYGRAIATDGTALAGAVQRAA